MNKHSRITPNVFRFAVLALAIAGAGKVVAADTTATTTGVVVAPIQIDKATDLSFGNFAAGSAAGTLALGTDGSRTGGNGVVVLGNGGSAAQFDVTGQASATYSIGVTATPLTSGVNSMTFAPAVTFVASADSTTVEDEGTLSAGGTQSFFVGGVLSVGASQAAGTYAGTITATVEYN